MSGGEGERFPLRDSLFPNVPPYIRMLPFEEEYSPPLPQELKQFTMNAPSGISPVVVNTIKQAGFSLVQGQVRQKEDQQTGAIWDCLSITEKSKDEINFHNLNEEVKINQFPGLFSIGRKDNLWTCYKKMRDKFGLEHFDFLPDTYILPKQAEELASKMDEKQSYWIIKPPNWFCGIGISVVKNKSQIPKKKSVLCVQEYIDRPFLIKGLKFDLRLYVLLTSIDPVRLYIYEDGLVRFATAPYSNSEENMENNFMHLTNFSVNKNNQEFIYNENPGEYEGHKWNLKTLWKYFEEELKMDWRPVWENIKDVCTKTVLCGHEELSQAYRKQIKSEYSCYKLFGFDVFIDADLKPWLLEVNNIPSLHINTIDAFVNYPMVAEMFNLVGFHIPKLLGSKFQKKITEKLNLRPLPSGSMGYDVRLYTKLLLDRDAEKRKVYTSRSGDQCNRGDILQDLTPADLRTLIHTEDELTQSKQFSRIFPAANKGEEYLKLLIKPSYTDTLLQAWEEEYGESPETRAEGISRLKEHCTRKEHLEIPTVIFTPLGAGPAK